MAFCASNTTVASLQAALARDHYAVVPSTAMFELLCGEPPFRSKKVSALRDMHQSEHRPRPSERVPGIPEAIDEVVLKLMARDPLERYQSAGELIAALEELVRTHDIASIAEQKRSNRRTTKTYKTIVVPSGVDALEDEEAEPLALQSLHHRIECHWRMF